MGVAVAFAVLITRQVLRQELVEGQQDIMADIGVGVFIDGNPGRCMWTKNGDNPILDAAFGHDLFNLTSDVKQLIAAGRGYR